MPYTNVPPEMQDKFDRCVEKVMATGKDKEAAIAICYTSLVEGKARTDPGCCGDDEATGIMGMLKALGDAIQAALGGQKAGARHSKADNEMIQSMHDNAVQLGAMCKGMRDCKSSFVVLKDNAGGYRWLGVVSNNYTDLDGEVLTDAAHKDFIAFLDQHPDQAPEWWTWHVDVGRKARADVWDYDGHFLWMSGPATAEQAAPYIAQDIGPRGMSHGFRARKEGEAITLYRTFEVSDLPLDKAANSWTAFEVVSKEAQMAFTPDKRADLVKLFGEEKVRTLEESSESTAKALDAAGVSFKAAKAEAPMPPAPEVEIEAEPPAAAPPQSAAMDMAPHMEALAGIAGKLAELQAAIAAIVQTMGAPSEMAAEREAAKKDRAMLSTIAAQVAEQGEQIKALQRTDDEKVAAVLQPRTAPFARGVRATEAAPVVTEKDAAQVVRENQFSWVKQIGPLA